MRVPAVPNEGVTFHNGYVAALGRGEIAPHIGEAHPRSDDPQPFPQPFRLHLGMVWGRRGRPGDGACDRGGGESRVGLDRVVARLGA